MRRRIESVSAVDDISIAELNSNRQAVVNRQPTVHTNLLQIHWFALATDSRDRIFALLGLANECQTLLMNVDYTLSTWEVFLLVVTP
jgi:hypothetical protein